MNKEYETVRKALLALLCVGDEVRWLRSNSILTNYYISTHIISEINGEEIVFRDWSLYKIYKKHFECYKGQLYLWDTSDAFYPYRGKRRIQTMTEILAQYESTIF
jgi:hypothetical protein